MAKKKESPCPKCASRKPKKKEVITIIVGSVIVFIILCAVMAHYSDPHTFSESRWESCFKCNGWDYEPCIDGCKDDYNCRVVGIEMWEQKFPYYDISR